MLCLGLSLEWFTAKRLHSCPIGLVAVVPLFEDLSWKTMPMGAYSMFYNAWIFSPFPLGLMTKLQRISLDAQCPIMERPAKAVLLLMTACCVLGMLTRQSYQGTACTVAEFNGLWIAARCVWHICPHENQSVGHLSNDGQCGYEIMWHPSGIFSDLPFYAWLVMTGGDEFIAFLRVALMLVLLNIVMLNLPHQPQKQESPHATLFIYFWNWSYLVK